MSSNRKKAESIASNMMILVDFEKAMVKDVRSEFVTAAKVGPFSQYDLTVLEIVNYFTVAANQLMAGWRMGYKCGDW